MPKISALVHISNNERHLGRALESLRQCDEVIVVDHGSKEESSRVAREHGARIIQGGNGVDRGAYVQDVQNDWIFCLRPTEAVAEELEASLLEWKQTEPAADVAGYNIQIREQIGTQWRLLGKEVRLANRRRINRTGDCPEDAPGAPMLAGHILRIPEEGSN